jgi:hypothetical protein
MPHVLPISVFLTWSPEWYLVRSTEHKSPFYVVFSTLMLPHSSWAQISSSALYSRKPSAYIPLSMCVYMCIHTHMFYQKADTQYPVAIYVPWNVRHRSWYKAGTMHVSVYQTTGRNPNLSREAVLSGSINKIRMMISQNLISPKSNLLNRAVTSHCLAISLQRGLRASLLVHFGWT